MKKYLSLLFCLLALLPLSGMARSSRPDGNMVLNVTGAAAKVYYSFDHYASNPKVSRKFISGEMLKAASHAKLWKSSAWNISGVADRLTSVLSLHTHSVSTTKSINEDMKKVMKMKSYELYMQTYQGDVKFIAFCHRGKGKTIEELLIFKFRSSYCSRVIQLTGKLRAEDIAQIIK